MNVELVMAREPLPAAGQLSVFLGGPTPESGGPPSWRPAAVEHLADRWRGPARLAVLSPQSRAGRRAAHYDDQLRWEWAARERATVRLYWVPRDMATLPGMTTNVEVGYDLGRGRTLVLGCPPDCPNPERNRYLVRLAQAHGMPVRTTLGETASTAIQLLTEPVL